MKVNSDHRSKFSNLRYWMEEACKISGLQRVSNPYPPRYRCDARPTELWSDTLGTRSICWGRIFPCSAMMWNIYEIHICTAVADTIYFTSFHCAGRYEPNKLTSLPMNSTNWRRSQCVASQLSWLSIAPVSRRPRVWILLKPWYFSGFFLPIAEIRKFTVMITLHFHL